MTAYQQGVHTRDLEPESHSLLFSASVKSPELLALTLRDNIFLIAVDPAYS